MALLPPSTPTKTKSSFNLSKILLASPTRSANVDGRERSGRKSPGQVLKMVKGFETLSVSARPVSTEEQQQQSRDSTAMVSAVPAALSYASTSPTKHADYTAAPPLVSPTVPASFFQHSRRSQSANRSHNNNNNNSSSNSPSHLPYPRDPLASSPSISDSNTRDQDKENGPHGKAGSVRTTKKHLPPVVPAHSTATDNSSAIHVVRPSIFPSRGSMSSGAVTAREEAAVESAASNNSRSATAPSSMRDDMFFLGPRDDSTETPIALSQGEREREPPAMPNADRTETAREMESKTAGARRRANTLQGGLLRSRMDDVSKAGLPIVVVESQQEKEARVSAAWELALDSRQLTNTVRHQMSNIAFPLKEQMLKADAASSSRSLDSSSILSPTPSKHSRSRSDSHTRVESFSLFPLRSPSKSIGSVKSFFSTRSRSRSHSRSRLPTSPTSDDSTLPSLSASAADASKSLKAYARPRSHSHSRSHSGSTTSSIFNKVFHVPAILSREGSSDGVVRTDGEEGSAWWAVRLRSAKCKDLGVKEIGRLRSRLRSEAPSWVEEFIRCGGYAGLLERFKELLEIEWREEQHGDQLLHELLRCFKALLLTSCGRSALASQHTTPFLPIASLLFSEKRPGDLPCRQLLVEMITALFETCSEEIQLPLAMEDWSKGVTIVGMGTARESAAQVGNAGKRYTRKVKDDDDSIEDGREAREEAQLRARRAHDFVDALMRGPGNAKELAKVDFIREAQRPRVYKLWVKELADVVRDYFWIFCHSSNLFWTLDQIDADQIEAPRVPSGMTGGVECEAMLYCTEHLRLINALASTCITPEAAFGFHLALFQSGLERVLLTLRRASLVYYPTLHLELSRYISLARSARFNLGPIILQCVDASTLSRAERTIVEREHEMARMAAAAKEGDRRNKVLPELKF